MKKASKPNAGRRIVFHVILYFIETMKGLHLAMTAREHAT